MWGEGVWERGERGCGVRRCGRGGERMWGEGLWERGERGCGVRGCGRGGRGGREDVG